MAIMAKSPKKIMKMTDMWTAPVHRVARLDELLREELIIPIYQRPYKWTQKNVIQLLEDIFDYVEIRDKDYRLGSIILHKEDGKNNIVDGQQRLTTVSLLLKVLDRNFEGLLLGERYTHNISKNNIAYNYRILGSWIDSKFKGREEKASFKEKILGRCQFVLFTVFQQEEAFQLFDSQNARGKALEPYDLLKAFHLREMEADSEEDRTTCVENWEASVDNGTLKPILGNHLYRIRKWSKNEQKYNFTKDEIDEFKGVSLRIKQKYPYELPLRLLDGLVENSHSDKISNSIQPVQNFPFQITGTIINGKRFFEYVDFYIRQREKLFGLDMLVSENFSKAEFTRFYKEYCSDYSTFGRGGDEKVRNLYENILIAFTDRFGLDGDFENFYKAFYRLAYHIRCDKKRIGDKIIMDSAALLVFKKINNSLSTIALKDYQFKTYKIDGVAVKGIEKIISFIGGSNGK